MSTDKSPQAETLDPRYTHALTLLHTCSECDGTNVQIAMWVRVNVPEVMDDFHEKDHPGSTWCEDCQEHTTIKDTWGWSRRSGGASPSARVALRKIARAES